MMKVKVYASSEEYLNSNIDHPQIAVLIENGWYYAFCCAEGEPIDVIDAMFLDSLLPDIIPAFNMEYYNLFSIFAESTSNMAGNEEEGHKYTAVKISEKSTLISLAIKGSRS